MCGVKARARILGPCLGWSRIVSRATRRESAGEFQRAGTILRRNHGDLIVSRRKLRQAGVIELVRETANQTLGFASRPFVLCGRPVRKPKKEELQVTGHPGYGLPWGQDRLLPIFLRTKLSSVRNFTGRSWRIR
jgi:hypothetical protein